MKQLTLIQYNSLVDKIYSSLIALPEMGMGEMGDCMEEAKIIVHDWMQENKIELND